MFSEDKNMEEIRTADVIIIGGGIMGCATAYRLTNKGIKEERLKATGYGLHLPSNVRGHSKLNPVGVRLIPHNFAQE